MDLHIHSPASVDYQQQNVSMIDILRTAEERGLDIVALTDHNSVRGYADMWREIEDLELLEFLGRLAPNEKDLLAEYRRLMTNMLILPGFEFTAAFGFHILAVFPETTSVRLMEHLLMSLGVPEDKFGSGEVGATTDVLRAYELCDEHGGLVIAAHVNSTHGVAMQGLRFGGQTRIAYTQDEHLHALEVTDLEPGSTRRTTAKFFSGTKAEYPRQMHCIQGSDAHRLDRDPNRDTNLGIGERPTEVLLSEVSFSELKALFKGSDFERTRPYIPVSPVAARLREARDLGPGPTMVFHEQISVRKTHPHPVVRDIAALANGTGGTVILGAGPSDRKKPIGLADPEGLLSAIQADAESGITPGVPFTHEMLSLDDKQLMAITVEEGREKPYAISPAAIYIRPADETVLAGRDDIIRLVTSSAAPPPAPPQRERAPQERPQPERAPQPAAARSGRQPRAERPVEPQRPVAVIEEQAPSRPRRRDEAVEPQVPPNGGRFIVEEDPVNDPVAPRSGVEIVDWEEQDGKRFYVLRDLRNANIVRNVTRTSARRLWRYAIEQFEDRPVDEDDIRWRGDFGFWKFHRVRGAETKYNLAWRDEENFRIFYGVGDEGLDGRWQAVIPDSAADAAQFEID